MMLVSYLRNYRPEGDRKRTITFYKPSNANRMNRRLMRINLRPLILLLAVLLIGALIYLLRNNFVYFRVQYIKYEGNDVISTQRLDATLSDLMNSPILSIKPGQIEQRLVETINEVKQVRVEKQFPRTLLIKLVEKRPLVIFQNFHGKAIIDRDGEVLALWKKTVPLHFEDYEYQLARGYGNINGGYVEDFIRKNLTEEEQKSFDFTTTEASMKLEAYNELLKGILEKFNRALEAEYEIQPDLGNYSQLLVLNAWDETAYEKGSILNPELVEFVGEIIAQSSHINELKIVFLLWDGDLRVILHTQDGKEIVFTRDPYERRTAEIQFRDLQALYVNLGDKWKGVSRVELGSEKIVVRY